MPTARILVGDVRDRLAQLDDGTVQTCVTSPPYWGLRDYGYDGQLGLEQTPEEYVDEMVGVFREVRRVLADDGTLWLNVGDSYVHNTEKHPPHNGTDPKMATSMRAKVVETTGVKKGAATGLPSKNLVGIPWRLAFALQADGWWLRQDIIWAKPNPMPESVTDRCTKAHEYVFLLSKSAKYSYDADALREPHISDGRGGFSNKASLKTIRLNASHKPSLRDAEVNELGRNKRSVWNIATKPYAGAHFAVMPSALVEPCILAGSRPGDLVLDPFAGSGTVGVVALRHNRNFIGVELNPAYAALAESRIYDDGPLMNTVEVG